MDRLLQQFEKTIIDRNGDELTAYLYGRSRPGDTWQAWIVFESRRDGRRYETPVETTQSSAEAVLYWATGLTDAYFDGALARAMAPREPEVRPLVVPVPVVGDNVDHALRAERLAEIEAEIIAFFSRNGSPRLRAQTLFDALSYANADVVRALEDMEKRARLLVRRTEEGNDWIFLTDAGMSAAKLSVPHGHEQVVSELKGHR